MRSARRADFAYGNTRLHARRGELLRGADYERLLGEDVDGLLDALDGTPYARDVDAAGGDDGLRRLHETIRSHLSRSLEEMRSFYAERARRVVDLLLSRFDIHNVVTVLRAQAGTHRRPRARSSARVGWLVEPLAGEILRQHELAGAVDLLARSTPDRSRPARCGRHSASTRSRRISRRSSEPSSPTTRCAPPPRSRPRAGRRRRCCGSRGARSTSATSWSPSACAMRSLRRRAEPPPRHAAPRRIGPARRVRGRRCALRAGRGRRRRSRASARDGGSRRCNGGRRPATSRAGARAGAPPDRGRDRAVRHAATRSPIDVPLAFTAAKQTEARNLRLLGEASARGIHAEIVRRELLWPEARA